MTDIKRYGAEGGVGQGKQHMPFSRAVEADGWLYVSGQVPMRDGELVGGTVTEQSHVVIGNVLAILAEAGYGPDAIGSALPRIMRILQAEDVRIEVGRALTRKEREYVRVQLEIGLEMPEIVAGLKA